MELGGIACVYTGSVMMGRMKRGGDSDDGGVAAAGAQLGPESGRWRLRSARSLRSPISGMLCHVMCAASASF